MPAYVCWGSQCVGNCESSIVANRCGSRSNERFRQTAREVVRHIILHSIFSSGFRATHNDLSIFDRNFNAGCLRKHSDPK